MQQGFHIIRTFRDTTSSPAFLFFQKMHYYHMYYIYLQLLNKHCFRLLFKTKEHIRLACQAHTFCKRPA